MDLLGTLGILHRVLGLFTGTPGSQEIWATSEEAFAHHFGESYDDFVEIVQHLSPEQIKLFEATLAVNPEAAVIWILAMEAVD